VSKLIELQLIELQSKKPVDFMDFWVILNSTNPRGFGYSEASDQYKTYCNYFRKQQIKAVAK